MTKEFSPEQCRQLIRRVPPKLKEEFWGSQEVADFTEQIAEIYRLDSDQRGVVADRMNDVAIGAAPRSRFAEAIMGAGIEKEVAKAIADEIDAKVFEPIKAELTEAVRLYEEAKANPTILENTSASISGALSPSAQDVCRDPVTTKSKLFVLSAVAVVSPIIIFVGWRYVSERSRLASLITSAVVAQNIDNGRPVDVVDVIHGPNAFVYLAYSGAKPGTDNIVIRVEWGNWLTGSGAVSCGPWTIQKERGSNSCEFTGVKPGSYRAHIVVNDSDLRTLNFRVER